MNRRDMLKGAGTVAMLGAVLPSREGLAEPEERRSFSEWKSVAPGVWRSTLGVPEVHTPVRSRRIAPNTNSLRLLPEVASAPLRTPVGKITDRGAEFQLELAPGELMYGFGLQLLSFQQRSKKRIVRVNADPKVDSGDSHAPVPFYVTTRGYGVLVDTLRHATFYCGEAHPRPTEPEPADRLQVNTPQMMRVGERELESRVVVEVPRCAGIDVYLFAGPQLRDAVQRYNLFSGGGVLPPDWGLGFWYRAEMHLDAAEILGLANRLRESAIPCDVLGLEPGWQTHAYSCTFAWNKQRFPDPGGFVRAAGDLKFGVNLWEHAFTHPASPIFSELAPHSGDFAVWGGLVPDFAGEPARRVFGEYHGRALIDLGVSGFKLDECDNSDFTEGWSFPDNSAFPSGVDGEQMHSEFGLRYQDTILEQYRERGKATYGLVRSSHALAAPYPFVLYSDLYDHRQFIRALLNAGFSGLLWCPEVRDASSEDDLIRRLQSVIFSPLAMVNAWYIRNPPWMQINREKNNRDEFTEGWERLRDRCREIISWRMRLLPYLQAVFAEYEQTGMPPFRALVMDYPDDPALKDVDDEYLMGDRLLVAPLFAGEAERRILLPSGEWQDFWTGEVMSGRTHTVSSAMPNIPVYVKAGSLVPWADVGQHSEAPESRRITVRVYGDGHLGWSSADRVGGLRLGWNAAEQRGKFEQGSQAGRKFEIAGWEKVG